MTVLIVCILALLLLGLAAGAGLIAGLRRQTRAIEARIARLEARRRGELHQPRATGAGTVLNDFELPRLEGAGSVTLSAFRGRRLAVAFLGHDCPGSRALVDALASTPPDRVVLLVTTEAGLGRAPVPDGVDVVVQRDLDLARVWWVRRAPSAYLVDPEGVTETPLLEGARAIGEALGLPGAAALPAETSSLFGDRVFGGIAPPAPGTTLPDLELTLLDGARIRLRGGPPGGTLLVLTDPDCEACAGLPDALAAHRGPERLLVVVRGTTARAAAIAKRLPNDAQVAAVVTGEVGRAVGCVATPTGLRIDAAGTLLAAPAIGLTAIAALVAAAPAGAVR